MDILSLVNLMADARDCGANSGLGSVMSIIGYVIWGIKVVVPIILIIVGMIDMGKAVTQKDENDIKKTQNALIKKLIAAVVVFLVPTLVTLVMTVIGSSEFKSCATCLNNPWNEGCGIKTSIPEASTTSGTVEP